MCIGIVLFYCIVCGLVGDVSVCGRCYGGGE